MTDLEIIKSILLKKKPELKKSGVTELGLFGSYLKGNQTPDSDVDILIDLAQPTKLDLLDLITIEQELSEALNTPVDLVLKSNLKPNIGKEILSEVQYL